MATQPARPDPCEGRGRILAAALEEFSTHGVDGTTLRQIAERAGTQHQLIVYHFGSKENLWKAVVRDVCAEALTWQSQIDTHARQEGAASALRMLVSNFVRFTARRPELHRMLTFEGRCSSDRLQWWLEEFVAAFYALSTRLIRDAQKQGHMRPGHPGRLHYGMIGLVTTSFVFEPEFRAMTKLNPFSPREVEEMINLALSFLGLAPGQAF